MHLEREMGSEEERRERKQMALLLPDFSPARCLYDDDPLKA